MGLFSWLGDRKAARTDRRRQVSQPEGPTYLDWIEHYTIERDRTAGDWHPPASADADSEARKVS